MYNMVIICGRKRERDGERGRGEGSGEGERESIKGMHAALMFEESRR